MKMGMDRAPMVAKADKSMVDSMPGIKAWWGNMKVRKSMSKENYVAYTVLPSLDEIRSNKLRSISINV